MPFELCSIVPSFHHSFSAILPPSPLDPRFSFVSMLPLPRCDVFVRSCWHRTLATDFFHLCFNGFSRVSYSIAPSHWVACLGTNIAAIVAGAVRVLQNWTHRCRFFFNALDSTGSEREQNSLFSSLFVVCVTHSARNLCTSSYAITLCASFIRQSLYWLTSKKPWMK